MVHLTLVISDPQLVEKIREYYAEVQENILKL